MTSKEWYQANRDRVLTMVKTRYALKKDEINAYKKEYRLKNRDKVREGLKRWHLANPGYQKKRYDPLKNKAHCHNRRIKTAGLTTPIVQMVYEDNIKKYGTLTCYLCEQPIVFGNDNLEHRTPVSRGGDSSYSNLAVACHSCNHKKYNRTEEEYRARVAS